MENQEKHMIEQYGKSIIIEDFQQLESVPVRMVEQNSIFHYMGNVQGASVLDLGCGEGLYCRELIRRGAKKVVGVDLAEPMIEAAMKIETQNNLGIEYQHADVKKMGKIDEFDFVIAVYLLHYSVTKDELLQMAQNIYMNLKPGGIFVAMNDNVEQDESTFQADTKKYGFVKTLESGSPLSRGSMLRYTLFPAQSNISIPIDISYLPKEDYEWAFQNAGFSGVSWADIQISKEIEDKFDPGFWELYSKLQPLRPIVFHK